MQIYNELTYINKSSVALGYFDGIHLGHRLVLNNAIHVAKKYSAHSVVILFKEHPLEYLTGQKIPQILTLEEKLSILEKIGIDNVILLDFKQYSNMKALDYLENVLVKYFSPTAITTGFNHYFGFNKEGNSDFLHKYEEKFGYKYYEVPPFAINEVLVSCSTIRNRIAMGDVVFANQLLGYNFFIQGIVEKGDCFARNLGFPSANIVYNEDKVQIPLGVYFVQVEIFGKKYNGILNHGFAPTFDKEENLKTEVHIIDFNKNIYGENIKISFITKIREQQKFESKEKLQAQIIRDKAFADIYKYFLKN